MREVGKMHDNTSVLELKKVWNSKDEALYSKEQQRFSVEGMCTYWLAMDRTLKFCDSTIMRRVAKFELKPHNKDFNGDKVQSIHSPDNSGDKNGNGAKSPSNDSLAGIEPLSKEKEDLHFPVRRQSSFDRYHWRADRDRNRTDQRRYSYPQHGAPSHGQ